MTTTRPTWDSTWLAVSEIMSKRSRCSRAQIGAVIVSSDGRVCSTGYNGPAASWPDQGECLDWCPRARGETALDRDYASCPAIHAEMNALMYVDRSRVEGGTIYVNGSLCINCAKAISNSGLSKVVYLESVVDDSHRQPSETVSYLARCGVEVVSVSRL